MESGAKPNTSGLFSDAWKRRNWKRCYGWQARQRGDGDAATCVAAQWSWRQEAAAAAANTRFV